MRCREDFPKFTNCYALMSVVGSLKEGEGHRFTYDSQFTEEVIAKSERKKKIRSVGLLPAKCVVNGRTIPGALAKQRRQQSLPEIKGSGIEAKLTS